MDLIIAFAGMAAHLAGVVASNTTIPVIGVPLNRTGFGGQDALLSTVQMPPGIPVATVGVDSGANAAWLALRILSLQDPILQKKLQDEKEGMKKKLLDKTQQVREKWNNES
jgi:5-(carboxyamino)imidazole ribonucleotide mutase